MFQHIEFFPANDNGLYKVISDILAQHRGESKLLLRCTSFKLREMDIECQTRGSRVGTFINC